MFADFALIQRAMNIERNMQDRAKPSDSGSSEQESVDKEDSGAVANSVVAARSRFRVSASDETHSDADGDESDNSASDAGAAYVGLVRTFLASPTMGRFKDR